MIGWWIVVSTQSPEERDRAALKARRAAILAQWGTGADGIHWIEYLTEAGKAAKLAGGGYPNCYTARVAVCPANQVLTIDASGTSPECSGRQTRYEP